MFGARSGMQTVSGKRSAVARLAKGSAVSPRPCSSRRTLAGGLPEGVGGGGMTVMSGGIAGGKSAWVGMRDILAGNKSLVRPGKLQAKLLFRTQFPYNTVLAWYDRDLYLSCIRQYVSLVQAPTANPHTKFCLCEFNRTSVCC